MRVLALGDVGDLLEGRPCLFAQDPPASSGDPADGAEVLFVFVLELLRVPHVRAVDHEGIRGSSDVLVVTVTSASTDVGRAAGSIVVKDDVQGGAVLDDLLETRIELLD